MPPRTFEPGFRLSRIDVAVLVVGGIGAGVASSTDRMLAMIILFVVGHFFLFCNVLRMSRSLELIWAAVFAALAISTIRTGSPGWAVTYGSTALVTIILAAIELRAASYHGVGWRRLNPKLPDWWAARQCTA